MNKILNFFMACFHDNFLHWRLECWELKNGREGKEQIEQLCRNYDKLSDIKA